MTAKTHIIKQLHKYNNLLKALDLEIKALVDRFDHEEISSAEFNKLFADLEITRDTFQMHQALNVEIAIKNGEF